MSIFFDERLLKMLGFDALHPRGSGVPRSGSGGLGDLAINDRYRDQDPQWVARELGAAAQVLARRFGRLSGENWIRKGSLQS
jgi:hypothetical protein